MKMTVVHAIVLASISLLAPVVTANVYLVNHGYEGVTVSISVDVPEDQTLVSKLETYLTEASAVLFRATKNQLYFKEFIFVIPEHWKTLAHYENALDVDLEAENIIIDKPNLNTENTPYVLSSGQCGKQGKFIHLTPDYILDYGVTQRYGAPGKVIVHEWGHFRYGLFDEYPVRDSDHFYLDSGQWRPTRCSAQVTGKMQEIYTNEPCSPYSRPGSNCRFYPDMDTPAVSSIMYMQFLDNVVEFCDDPDSASENLKHNRLALNPQNRLCNFQSSWEVMRKNQDFISLANQSALPINTNTQPTFRYVQVKPRKRVLVLDTSGSMRGQPLTNMLQTASNIILSTVEADSFLGIVEFSNTATVLSGLVEIQSDNDRVNLINLLPTVASGGTSIGAGLEKGRQVLNPLISSKGGTIILITDGKENTAPMIDDVLPSLLQDGIVVHSGAYGQSADPSLAGLASQTGGKSFFYSGSENSTGFLDGLVASITSEGGATLRKDVSFSLLTHAGVVTGDAPSNGFFYIDSTIGKDTTLTFSSTERIDVDIHSPAGAYTPKNVAYFNKSSSSTSANILRITLYDNPITGRWTYSVTTNGTSSAVTVNVQSKARSEGSEVIKINSWISVKDEIQFQGTTTIAVYAEVRKGRTPVLGAVVIATLERPSGEPLELALWDNEIGADVTKNDGVYSANVIAKDLQGDGRYSIKINVVGTKDQAKVITGRTLIGQAFDQQNGALPTVTQTEALDDFQRTSTTGEFRVTGFRYLLIDEVPPARISDFQLNLFQSDTVRAFLRWTAVGGDMERGTASLYHMYVYDNLTNVLTRQASPDRISDQDVVFGSLASPSAAGDREEVVVEVRALADTSSKKTVYLSVVAVDEEGNIGALSNVITLTRVGEELATTTSTTKSPNDGTDGDDKVLVGIALAVVGLVLVILLGTVVAVFVYWKKQRENVRRISPQGERGGPPV